MIFDPQYKLTEDPDFQNADHQLRQQKQIRYHLLLGKEKYLQSMKIKALGPDKIRDYLKEKYQVDLSRATVESLYNPKSNRSSIDISAVVALCDWWQLDITRVLAPPEQLTTASGNNYQDFGHNKKLFFDKNYAGTFYCYFFRLSGTDTSFTNPYPNSLPKKEDLMEGTITFDIDEETGSKASFEYIQAVHQFNAPDVNKKKRSTCFPVVSEPHKNVYLDFIDNDGRLYYIFFDHQEFKSGPLYFRIGGMVTEASEIGNLPIFQKIVLFHEKPEEKYYDYIRGFLNFNPHNLIISPKELEELAKKDEELDLFFRYYRSKLEPHRKEVYCFNESIITKEPAELSEYQAKKALIKLRHYTFSQNQMTIGNDVDAHRIARKLQLQNEEVEVGY